MVDKTKKMENKKAELTSKQLVTIIILIVSFAIIIAFFFMMNFKGTIDKESCRNSVIMRGALPFGTEVISLKCKTQDICLSMGENCDVSRKDMITIDVNNEEELVEEMVNLLWDCWWVMGEGKVDYMSAGIGIKEAYCSICSKVYFDSEIQGEYTEGISYKKIYDYMEKNKVPSKDETYLFSIYGFDSLDLIRKAILDKGNYDIYEYKANPMKEYVVVTSITKEGWGKGWTIPAGVIAVGGAGAIAGAKGAAIGTVISPGVGTAIGAGVGVVAGVVGGIVVSSKTEDTYYMAPRYLEFDGKELEALDCKEYVSEI